MIILLKKGQIMNRIKELRKEKKLTLKALAQKINEALAYDLTMINGKLLQVTDSQLSQYENENRSPRNNYIWEKLADVFDVSVPYLLGYSDFRVLEDSTQAQVAKWGKVDEETFYLNPEFQKDLARAVITERYGEKRLLELQNMYSVLFDDILTAIAALADEYYEQGLLLDFILLSKQNKEKAIEQVRNLLIVQNSKPNTSEVNLYEINEVYDETPMRIVPPLNNHNKQRKNNRNKQRKRRRANAKKMMVLTDDKIIKTLKN